MSSRAITIANPRDFIAGLNATGLNTRENTWITLKDLIRRVSLNRDPLPRAIFRGLCDAGLLRSLSTVLMDRCTTSIVSICQVYA